MENFTEIEVFICKDCPNTPDPNCEECPHRGPICPICESVGKTHENTRWALKSMRGAMWYFCNECKNGFYG